MTVYNDGDKVKVKETTGALGVNLEKGMKGVVAAAYPGRVEVAFEGLGMVSVTPDLIKKKVRKTEKLVKAKNLKLTDEVHIPGSGEYRKIGHVSRVDYDSVKPAVTIETMDYDSKEYGYDELVEVRR